jgi:hypothetical protein
MARFTRTARMSTGVRFPRKPSPPPEETVTVGRPQFLTAQWAAGEIDRLSSTWGSPNLCDPAKANDRELAGEFCMIARTHLSIFGLTIRCALCKFCQPDVGLPPNIHVHELTVLAKRSTIAEASAAVDFVEFDKSVEYLAQAFQGTSGAYLNMPSTSEVSDACQEVLCDLWHTKYVHECHACSRCASSGPMFVGPRPLIFEKLRPIVEYRVLDKTTAVWGRQVPPVCIEPDNKKEADLERPDGDNEDDLSPTEAEEQYLGNPSGTDPAVSKPSWPASPLYSPIRADDPCLAEDEPAEVPEEGPRDQSQRHTMEGIMQILQGIMDTPSPAYSTPSPAYNPTCSDSAPLTRACITGGVTKNPIPFHKAEAFYRSAEYLSGQAVKGEPGPSRALSPLRAVNPSSPVSDMTIDLVSDSEEDEVTSRGSKRSRHT